MTKFVWSSGWNIPGYLPDVEPLNFDTFGEARDALHAALEQAIEDYDGPHEGEHRQLYAEALNELECAPDGHNFTMRVGNYAWWVQGIHLPETEG